MTPITNILGLVAHKPTASAAVHGFGVQLDMASRPTPVADAPTRGSVGHMHTGGLNDVAHRMQALAAALPR